MFRWIIIVRGWEKVETRIWKSTGKGNGSGRVL